MRASAFLSTAVLALAALFLAACPPAEEVPEPAPPVMPIEDPLTAQRLFFENLSAFCNQTFPGHADFHAEEDSELLGEELAMVVETCEADQLRIPFHVGEDTWSRTWVLTLSAEGLLLKHDHRHQDGTPEEITNYGGWADDRGTEHRQYFPADAETAEIIPEAATNVWLMEIDPEAQTFTYYLERHDQPRFRAVFDLAVARD